MKQQIMLTLDAAVIEECKSRGINISGLCNSILEKVLSTGLSADEIAIAILEEHKENTEGRIKELTERHEQVIAILGKEVEKYTAQIHCAKSRLAEMRKSTEVAKVMRELNKEIMDNNFDLGKILKSANLEKLREFGLTIDEDWVKRQIQRIELFRI